MKFYVFPGVIHPTLVAPHSPLTSATWELNVVYVSQPYCLDPSFIVLCPSSF